MKLLVGIPSFRRPAMLAALLRSLASQSDLSGVTVEVFVADNDPVGAEAVALCRTLSAYPLPLDADTVTEPGISAARNRILEEAQARRADLLAMIDDDEVAAPRWLAELVAARAAFGAQVIGGAVTFRFEQVGADAFVASGAFAPKRGVSGPIDLLNSSSNVLFDCAALAWLGWPRFDERFGLTGGEDKEYFTRLKAGGLRFAWTDMAMVYETVPAERMLTRAIVRRAYGIGSSDYRIAALHGGWPARLDHLAKAAVILATAPLLAPGLAIPRFRLWLLRRFARACGRLAGAVGIGHAHYGGAISP